MSCGCIRPLWLLGSGGSSSWDAIKAIKTYINAIVEKYYLEKIFCLVSTKKAKESCKYCQNRLLAIFPIVWKANSIMDIQNIESLLSFESCSNTMEPSLNRHILLELFIFYDQVNDQGGLLYRTCTLRTKTRMVSASKNGFFWGFINLLLEMRMSRS